MDSIDEVEDIVYSQRMSSAEEVASAVLAIAEGEQVEISLPASAGWLTTLGYLLPGCREHVFCQHSMQKDERIKTSIATEPKHTS